MSEANRAVVQKFYTAGHNRDIHEIIECLADDVVVVEPERHPLAGTYKGRDEALRVIGQLAAVVGFVGIDVHEIIVDGPQRAVVLLDLICTNQRTGKGFRMPIAEFLLVEEGKITEIRPFWYDTAKLDELLR
jgi:hypothetical protein